MWETRLLNFFLALAMVLVLMKIPKSVVWSEPSDSMYIYPGTQTVTEGDTVTAVVKVNTDTETIGSVTIGIDFDETVLELADIESNWTGVAFLFPAPFDKAGYIADANANGQMRNGLSLFSMIPRAAGDNAFITLTFNAIGVGTSELEMTYLSDDKLMDGNFNNITTVVLHGSEAEINEAGEKMADPPPVLPVGTGEEGEKMDAVEQALQYVDSTYKIPTSDLRVWGNEVTKNPITNQEIEIIVIQDKSKADGHIWKLAVDPDGKVMDINGFIEMVASQHKQKYGKLAPDLFELLQSKAYNDKIKVNIWLKSDALKATDAVVARYPQAKLIGGRPSEDTDLSLYQQIQAEMNNAAKQAYKTSEQPIIEYVQSKGFNVLGCSDYSPVVFAELSKECILELSKRTDVDTIYQLRDDYKLPLSTAAPTIGAPTVWGSGYTGQDIKVAIIEPDAIDFTHPALVNCNGGYYIQPGDPLFFTFDPNLPGPDRGHATICAGCIASQDATYKGISPGVTLLSGNTGEWGDDRVVAATEWAINNGANIIIPEIGVATQGEAVYLDRYYDHIALADFITVVVPAGNIENDNWVTSPALGYNVLSVGNFNDANTPNWGDDTMATGQGGSRFVNPISGIEKPEIAAPGTDIVTSCVNPQGFEQFGGTSLAAPIVAGEAALLMQQNTTLKVWPELVRAVVMTSAIHNIEGDARLSDKDGAGGISVEYASQILSANKFETGTFTTTNFPVDTYKTYLVSANAGERVRAVICWDSHPADNANYDYPFPHALSSDLDMYVYAPDGSPILASFSFANSFEIIDFNATVSGQYIIKIRNFRMASWEWYGISCNCPIAPAPTVGMEIEYVNKLDILFSWFKNLVKNFACFLPGF